MALTFKQAQGIDPIPTQLSIGEFPQKAKARFWQLVDIILRDRVVSRLGNLEQEFYFNVLDFFIEERAVFADDFHNDSRFIRAHLKEYFELATDANDTLQLIQHLIRGPINRDELETFEKIFVVEKLAYRIMDSTIVRYATEQEYQDLVASIDLLEANGFRGAKEHLVAASNYLAKGKWSDSMRESIHAVESAVRKHTGEQKFSNALNKIAKDKPLHEAFKKSALSLYGYTSR